MICHSYVYISFFLSVEFIYILIREEISFVKPKEMHDYFATEQQRKEFLCTQTIIK